MKSKRLLINILTLALTMALSACSSGTSAKGEKETGIDFPKKPINMIVPFAAGGGMDTLARGLSDVASEYIDQSIVVVNRDGAGGTIGVAEGAKQKPDGYTVILSPSAVFTSQPHMKDVPYKLDDFKMLASVVYKPNVLVANIDSPYNSLNDIIEDAKKNNKVFKIGHTGVGTPGFLAQETLFENMGIKSEGVPFKGNNPNITALLGGHIDLSIAYTDEVLQNVRDKKLKVLGVFTPERFDQIPDVPTIAEAMEEAGVDYKYKDVPFVTSLFVMVPKDTPEDITKYLEENFTKMAQDPKFEEFGAKTDIPIKILDGNELMSILEKESEVFGNLINEFGIGKK